MFQISPSPLDPNAIRDQVIDPASGGFCSFEGWVRNHHEGPAVERLEYEAYPGMAVAEVRTIGDTARARWPIAAIAIVHRFGSPRSFCFGSAGKDLAKTMPEIANVLPDSSP